MHRFRPARSATSPALLFAAAMAATALLAASCGSGESSQSPVSTTETSAMTTVSQPDDTAADVSTTASADQSATPDTSSSAGSTTASPDESTAAGRAVATIDGSEFEFVVIQCLVDTPSPLVDDVFFEFQLDGVPAATPPEVIEELLGVIEADDDVMAQLEPVVEYGPILSITRLEDGGEQVFITDLGGIDITSEGDPTDPASRSLDITTDIDGVTFVTGSTPTERGTLSIDAQCP